MIITNSYQSNQNTLMKYMNITKAEADEYLELTVKLAKSAISEANVNRKIYIAGSIGPYPDCPASGVVFKNVFHRGHHRAIIDIANIYRKTFLRI